MSPDNIHTFKDFYIRLTDIAYIEYVLYFNRVWPLNPKLHTKSPLRFVTMT